jgi:hypothetical protein
MMSLLDEQFRAWENLLQEQSWRVKKLEDDISEMRPQPTLDQIEERWAQGYLKDEFIQLGFTKIDGPFNKGPDFRVLHKARWVWAEVETRWRNYLRHEHHTNPAFDSVKFLILLSSEAPPPDALQYLPPQIIYIDQQRFLAWYEKVSEPKSKADRTAMQLEIIAGAMNEHWTKICSDVDRDMSTCPECDACPYFGEGEFNEATPFFQHLATRFVISNGLAAGGNISLSQIKSNSLEEFVEHHPPGE